MKFPTTIRACITYSLLFLSSSLCAGDDQYFDSDGVQIRYRVIGNGTPVILVHGFTANFETNWSSVIDALKTKFRVIGLDARGHGQSDKPHDAEAYGSFMVVDVANLMDHLGLQKAHVVGYSMGGIIALKMASLYPDRIISAVTGGNGMFSDEDQAMIKGLYTPMMQKAIDQNIPVADLLFPPDLEVPPSAQRMAEALRSLDNDPRALQAAGEAMGRMNISPGEAAALHVPVLAIYGSLDDPLKTVARLKAAQDEVDVIIIEGEDHTSTPYAPAFIAAVQSYLMRFED